MFAPFLPLFSDEFYGLQTFVFRPLCSFGNMVINFFRDLAGFVAKAPGNNVQINTSLCHERNMSMAEHMRSDRTAENTDRGLAQILIVCIIIYIVTVEIAKE